MTFSVVVVVFRQGEVVERCLEHLLGQDYPKNKFEVVLVRSGSGLDPEAFSAAAKKAQVNFTFLDPGQGNVGPARGRNLGVTAVGRGQTKIASDLVAFTDDDTLVPPDWLSRLARVWQENPAAAGVGGVSLPSPQETRKNFFAKYDEDLYAEYFPQPKVDLGFLRQGKFKSYLSRKVLEHPVFSGNISYRRQVFQDVGGFDEGYGPGVYGEDAALKEKVLARGHFLVFAPTINEHLGTYDFWNFKRQQEGRGTGIIKFRADHQLYPQTQVEIFLRLVFSFLTFPFYLLKTGLNLRLSLLKTLGYFFRQWGKFKYRRKAWPQDLPAVSLAAPKTKILFLDHTPLLGGAQLALGRHLSALDRQKFAPAVIVSRGGPLAARFGTVGDLKVFQIDFPKLKARNFWLFFSLPRAVFKIGRLVKKFQGELLVANTERAFYLCLPAALFLKKRLILVVRDFEYSKHLLGLSRFKVEAYLCVSQKIADFYKFPAEKRKVIYVGSDLGRRLEKVTTREVTALKASIGIKPGAMVVGFVARLIKWKGPELILTAFHQILAEKPNLALHLIIAGEGPLRKSLETEALRLGILQKVSLVGEVSRVELWYKAFDIFVHASTGPEPFATTVIEAALAGCPIIATETGGTGEFIKDGENGLLIKAEVANLVAALKSLLAAPERRAPMGQKAFEKASKGFTEEIVTRKMEEVYRGRLN